MAGRVTLDTNIVIALFAAEQSVLDNLTGVDEVAITPFVLGELFYGALKSGRPAANVARVETFAAGTALLTIDDATAPQYAAIKEALRAKGKMIPENDIWIAASAVQQRYTLVTRDAHFEEIGGLSRETW